MVAIMYQCYLNYQWLCPLFQSYIVLIYNQPFTTKSTFTSAFRNFPAWGIAARSMRQILVERARARGAQKRWGGMNRVSLTDALAVASDPESVLPPLDDALTRLEQIDPEQARIVELRFFAGLSIEDTADALNMSPATLKRRWALARAWLFRELSESGT